MRNVVSFPRNARNLVRNSFIIREDTHVNGSTKLIKASRGPMFVRDPTNERSNPVSEMLLYCYVRERLPHEKKKVRT